MIRAQFLAVLVLIGASPALAEDWPQWLGPRRDSVWRETGIIESIPPNGLTVRWRTPIAGGYAGPAVADGKVFVSDYVRRDGDATNDPSRRSELQGSERVWCLDSSTGHVLWKHEYECPYKISYAAGPRATPTVDGDRVYTLGAEGNLLCLDVDSGEVVWSRAFKQDFHIQAPTWGFCGHPLIEGDKLICLVGGEGSVAVAFDKQTGRELWKALAASEPGYCPPSMLEAAGVRQLLIWHPESLNSLDPDTGKVYWSIPLKPQYGMSIAQPRRYGDYLFASGIGSASALLKIDLAKPGATVEWRGTPKTSLYSGNGTPFIEDGVVYGSDCQVGHLQAFDLVSGERLWQTFAPTTGGTRRASHGTVFIVKNGDRFFLFSETGDLVLAKLTREKYEELGRFKILEPTGEAMGRNVVWSHPAFANKCVFARNDNEIVCVSLAK
jgi:outer membrane protein assembly factor BamB